LMGSWGHDTIFSSEKFLDLFVNANTMSREIFIKRAFDAAFSMIPEAEKASYFELKGEIFKPILSYGYNHELLEQLSFHESEAFADYENDTSPDIRVYQVQIDQRDHRALDVEKILLLQELGTYEGFITLFAPIKFESKPVGIMCFDNFSNQDFSEDSKTFLKVYAQLLSNFYTMKLYQEEAEKKYQEIISALVSAIELKDAYTKGHAKRVMDLCTELGLALGFDGDRLSKLQSAAILHDVGKIGISTEILVKKGKLSVDEYQQIKDHPANGKKILEHIRDFEDITEIVYCHHERYDGLGYPRGLKGHEIPYDACLIQIVDAYDAMTSERAYRKAFSPQKALEIILEERGKQFHPDLADCFIDLIRTRL